MLQFEVEGEGACAPIAVRDRGINNNIYFIPIGLTTRYQPIVNISSGVTVGFELLSKIESIKNVDPEVFFRNLERDEFRRVVMKQIEQINSIYDTQHAFHNVHFFINISFSLLLSSAFVLWVCQNVKFKISLEIDYVDVSSYNKKRPATYINILSEHGHEIWLDDYDGGKVSEFVAQIPWSGIKIDKSFLWQHSMENRKLRAILSSKLLAGRKVIIEGIETSKQKETCLQAGFMLGQGFYWDERTDLNDGF